MEESNSSNPVKQQLLLESLSRTQYIVEHSHRAIQESSKKVASSSIIVFLYIYTKKVKIKKKKIIMFDNYLFNSELNDVRINQ